MTGSVLFHVQHLLGIGHVQRSLRIAEALAASGITVTLLSGGMPLPLAQPAAGIRVIQLHPIRARDASFALVGADGALIDDDLRAGRRAQVLAAFHDTRPDAVIIEGFPFARRAFRFELDPLITAVRETRPRPRLICSVRDIPTVRDDPERHRQIVERVRGDFDAVLVHGDAGFIPFGVSFPPTPRIADKLLYTGYVTQTEPTPPILDAPTGEVLVSVGGGGAVGQALIAAALGAHRRGVLADRGWRILAGAQVSDAALAALRREAPGGVTIERFRADFPTLLRGCHVSVSQAGYNTVLDILAARARAVLVPFAAERETEQLVRAERLAARGAAELVREGELSATGLAAAMKRAAVGTPRSIPLDTDGARKSARLIAQIITRGGTRAFARGQATV
jgi:predicted glycosyltransferase